MDAVCIRFLNGPCYKGIETPNSRVSRWCGTDWTGSWVISGDPQIRRHLLTNSNLFSSAPYLGNAKESFVRRIDGCLGLRVDRAPSRPPTNIVFSKLGTVTKGRKAPLAKPLALASLAPTPWQCCCIRPSTNDPCCCKQTCLLTTLRPLN